ncbi:MAG: DegV family protein [Roseburia inulinivorans]
MQKKVQIISDGSLDLSQELTKENDIEVVPFYVSFDSETYQKEMVEVGVREIYQEMVDHPTVFPKTSMPSVHDYYEVFEKYAKEQLPVICICITRKFSGSLQSATTAKDMILEEYPDAQITVIDSTVNTVLQGLYVLEACRLRDMDLEYQQIVDALLPIRKTGRIFFTIGSIDYLKHGGRIGKLAGIAASALKIKPLITLKEGEIFNSGITRNRLKSMKKVVDMTREYLDEVNAKPGEYSFCIGYGYDYNEALEFREMLKDLVKERLGIDEIGIYQIGATIGVHTGPYPIGIGIIKHALTE